MIRRAHKKDMEKSSKHQSVLATELLEYLKPKAGGRYLDATFGGGGHSKALLESRAKIGLVVALDPAPEAVAFAARLTKQFGKRFRFYQNSFLAMAELEGQFDGLIFDLGLSSDQLEDSGRGFTFSRDEVLDMRFDPTRGRTAAWYLNTLSEKALQQIFSAYAQDRYSRSLARKIVRQRQQERFTTTFQLVKAVGTDQPKVLAPIFQALRITVNDELNVLSQALEIALTKLNERGILAVISFHSLEDRIVKNFIKENSMEKLTKKPIIATETEVERNPRARSAKLRLAIKGAIKP